ncbi:MAG TPA: peptide deformylase [Chloroflexia bacterium]|nr:peptide deformylase [Chloroflexia bacterium]
MTEQMQVDGRPVDPVLQFTDERLRQISAPLPESFFDSAELHDWIARLNLSRQVYGGIGIAAPQIGYFQRLVVIDIPALERPGFGQVEAVPLHALINPEIVEFSDERIRAAEGCLSVRGYEGFVVRPQRIGLVYYTPEGKRQEIEATGLYARALQHEIDHLDGILYPDRVTAVRDMRKIEPVDENDPVLAYNRLLAKTEAAVKL